MRLVYLFPWALLFSVIISQVNCLVAPIPSTGTPPRPRSFSSLTNIASKLYSFGGLDLDQELTNEIQEFDLTSNQWRTLQAVSQNLPSPRKSSIFFSYQDSLYVFGGLDQSGIREELWQFNIALESWTLLQVIHTMQIARYKSAYTLVGNSLFVFGGVTTSGTDSSLLQ